MNASALGHEYFRWYAGQPAPPALARHPQLWQKAIDIWRDGMPAHRPTFIHRDFHPGNVIWSRREVVGVVDWVNVCQGPVGVDLAHCRANLRATSGPEVADRFLAAYQSLTGETLDPYWIIASHLEHDPEHWTAERLAAAEPDLMVAVRAAAG